MRPVKVKQKNKLKKQEKSNIQGKYKVLMLRGLGQCTALSNKTGCERYWEARRKMMEN